MKVYKFGGASVRNAEGVRNLRNIIDDEQNLFIIVSAMGKTTNALERVFEGVQRGDREKSAAEIARLREYHAAIIDDLWHGPTRLERVEALFAELDRVAAETQYRAADAELWYDTIVAFGELLRRPSSRSTSPRREWPTIGSTCAVHWSRSSATRTLRSISTPRHSACWPKWKVRRRRSSWDRVSSAAHPTGRLRRSAVRVQTTRRP